MRTCKPTQRLLCLDMFPVRWRSGRQESSDSVILLEITELDGLLQTNVAIPPGKRLTLELPNGMLTAKVSSCKKDDFGYLVEILVDSAANWFSGSYQPAYLKEKTTRQLVQSRRKRPAAARSRRKPVAIERAWKPAKGGRSHR